MSENKKDIQALADLVVLANATGSPDMFTQAVRDLLAGVRALRDQIADVAERAESGKPLEPAELVKSWRDAYEGAREDLLVWKRAAQRSAEFAAATLNQRDEWKAEAERWKREAAIAGAKAAEGREGNAKRQGLERSNAHLQEMNAKQSVALRAHRDQIEALTERAEAAERAVGLRLSGVSDDAILFAMNTVKVKHDDSTDDVNVRKGRAVLALTAPAVDAVGVRVDVINSASAPRMHDGGVVGLRPDEVPVILRAGEAIMPTGTGYTVEKHGKGWAIYQGRDGMHHGLNLGQLVETSGEVAAMVEEALNVAKPMRETLEHIAGGAMDITVERRTLRDAALKALKGGHHAD